MNPIPLSASDGRVYAYACGTCHHVAGGACLLVCLPEPGPIPVLVEGSLSKATQCCTCHRCGRAHPRGADSLLYCADCRWNIAMEQLWRTVATTYSLDPCRICGARITSIDCHMRPACVVCGEEHASYDDGKCRDCNLYGARTCR